VQTISIKICFCWIIIKKIFSLSTTFSTAVLENGRKWHEDGNYSTSSFMIYIYNLQHAPWRLKMHTEHCLMDFREIKCEVLARPHLAQDTE
jgi:hypothetical protein